MMLMLLNDVDAKPMLNNVAGFVNGISKKCPSPLCDASVTSQRSHLALTCLWLVYGYMLPSSIDIQVYMCIQCIQISSVRALSIDALFFLHIPIDEIR